MCGQNSKHGRPAGYGTKQWACSERSQALRWTDVQTLDSEATSPSVSTSSAEFIGHRQVGPRSISGEGGDKGTRPTPTLTRHTVERPTRFLNPRLAEGRRAAGRGPGRLWKGLKVGAEVWGSAVPRALSLPRRPRIPRFGLSRHAPIWRPSSPQHPGRGKGRAGRGAEQTGERQDARPLPPPAPPSVPRSRRASSELGQRGRAAGGGGGAFTAAT